MPKDAQLKKLKVLTHEESVGEAYYWQGGECSYCAKWLEGKAHLLLEYSPDAETWVKVVEVKKDEAASITLPEGLVRMRLNKSKGGETVQVWASWNVRANEAHGYKPT